jgi:hypothetical protein
VTRTGGIANGASVQFATSNGSALDGSDYTANSGTLTFAQGETNKTFMVSITNDGAFEPDETVNLTLSNPGGGATLGSQSAATLTITDNDAAPSFGISDVTLAEGNSGTTSFTFTVTKTGATAAASSVSFATADGTATTAGQDYTSLSGTLNFDPSDTSKPITVLVNGDAIVEGNETFFVNLSSPTNATISDFTGQGTINNDDTDVTVAVSSSSVTEDGATNLVYTFTRNGVSSGALTVNFSITGTASASDYTSSASGTVNFTAGSPTATVTISPIPDAIVEPDETVTLTLNSGGGYNVANPNAATGTITDAPLIFNEENTNNAIAINSVTFVRGPFRVFDDHNFSADQHTRIILLTSNLSLSQPDSSLLTVQASGFDLPVENVGAFTGIPGLDASYIVVRLPDNLQPGDLQLTVTLRGATSIARILSIVQ